MRDNAIAFYTIYDLPNGNRVHQWGFGEAARFAVGNGPIRYISRQEAESLAGRAVREELPQRIQGPQK
jgi:hypothetical protein